MTRIAVADDDPDLCDAIVAMLERDGHQVSVARDGRQALDLVERGDISLVLTDVFMPGCDGLSLLAAIRSRDQDLPVIAMTGGMDGLTRPYLEAMLALGADSVLNKPFSRHELSTATARALARGGGEEKRT